MTRGRFLRLIVLVCFLIFIGGFCSIPSSVYAQSEEKGKTLL